MSSEGSTEGLATEQALGQDHLCLNPEFAVQVHMVCLTSLCQTPVCKWKERTGSSRCGNTASGLSAAVILFIQSLRKAQAQDTAGGRTTACSA